MRKRWWSRQVPPGLDRVPRLSARRWPPIPHHLDGGSTCRPPPPGSPVPDLALQHIEVGIRFVSRGSDLVGWKGRRRGFWTEDRVGGRGSRWPGGSAAGSGGGTDTPPGALRFIEHCPKASAPWDSRRSSDAGVEVVGGGILITARVPHRRTVSPGGGGGGYPPLSPRPGVPSTIRDHHAHQTVEEVQKTITRYWRRSGVHLRCSAQWAFGRPIQKMLRWRPVSARGPLSGVPPHIQVRRVYEGKGKRKAQK